MPIAIQCYHAEWCAFRAARALNSRSYASQLTICPYFSQSTLRQVSTQQPGGSSSDSDYLRTFTRGQYQYSQATV
jgi:hypothetical protein